jgi:hypothetical protein
VVQVDAAPPDAGAPGTGVIERPAADAGPDDELDAFDRTDEVPAVSDAPRRHLRWVPYVVSGSLYLALGFVLWIHAWTAGATTHTLCGCGDPSLFTWFFQWPATALAHGQNPFFSNALFHGTGVNLLAQTSVTGLSIPLVPVTWIWGPVASLNVASTITPALTAFSAFVVLRRWAPWAPAAFVGGLLYGFSPFVLTSLEFAHLMTAALMLLPLILAALDEILVRQRHRAWTSGLVLGLLVTGQFFLSTELLAIAAMVAVISIAVLVVAALIADPGEVRRRAPHAAKGLAIGAGVGLVLLAWPLWFALAGPGHLSGLIWPNIGIIGGFVPSQFVSPSYVHGASIYFSLGGYYGPQLASAGYLGWGLLAVLAAGTVAFFRDRRLWFFGFLLVMCGVFSLGGRHGQWWEIERVFAHLPVLQNIIEQRFMAIGFLAAAVMLAIVLDRVHALVPAWHGVVAALAALAVAAVALVPMGATFGSRLPFTMKPVILPPWYTQVAPKLPPGRVVLSYPPPFSGIQSAMTWQAVDRMVYDQAGGGGPQGVAWRAGAARAGFKDLMSLAFGVGVPQPDATPAQEAAVRRTLAAWGVNTVVVSTNPDAPFLQQGHDPTYAAAFFTAVLGRLPKVQAGAWVWDDVNLKAHRALQVEKGVLAECVAKAEGPHQRIVASMRVADCVGLMALAGR